MMPPRFRPILLALLAFGAPLHGADFPRVVKTPGGGWFFEAEGKPFYSLGVCHIAAKEEPMAGKGGAYYDGAKVHGSVEKWAGNVLQRLQAAGFNTAGAWCDEAMYGQPLWRARYVWLSPEVDGVKERLMSVFSPGYEQRMEELVVQYVKPHAEDSQTLGWFLDNELPWYGQYGWPDDSQHSLLRQALALPAENANRAKALEFLQEHYGTFAKFAAAWSTSASSWSELATATAAPAPIRRLAEPAEALWAGKVADRFFAVNVALVRKYAPKQLILGCRFAGGAPGPVLVSAGRYCDVVSINKYYKDGNVDLAWWDGVYALTQKPLLLSEFSWRAAENQSGNRNSRGVDTTVANDSVRAERYGRVLQSLFARPYLVGAHWFQWADEPVEGRFDGEDSAYGLVDVKDQPYTELWAAAKSTHGTLPKPGDRDDALPLPAAEVTGTSWGLRASTAVAAGAFTEAKGVGLTATPYLSMDNATGAKVTAAQDHGWALTFTSATGWGAGASWTVAEGTKLAGARAVRLKVSSPTPVNFTFTANEKGTNGEPITPAGVADGESWGSGPLLAPGGAAVVELPLGELEMNAYYGNQQGAKKLDLDGLASVGVRIMGNQGHGQLTVQSMEFIP